MPIGFDIWPHPLICMHNKFSNNIVQVKLWKTQVLHYNMTQNDSEQLSLYLELENKFVLWIAKHVTDFIIHIICQYPEIELDYNLYNL